MLLRHRQLRTICSIALRECLETSDLKRAQKIHGHFIKTSCEVSDSLFIHNNLLNIYLKCGSIHEGHQLFDEMPERNVVTWTLLIAGFSRMGFSVEAISAFSDMHKTNITPNEYTLVSTLQACSSHNLDFICLLQVYSLIIRHGFENNIFLKNAFSTALTRHGFCEEALREFEEVAHIDIVSWNAILDGLLKLKKGNDIPHFFKRMITEGIKPDEFTFATVLTGLAELMNLEMGLQVQACLIKSGYGSERCVGNALVDMYLKNQRLNDGFIAFEEIPTKDVCSWTQMATGCLNGGKHIEALQIIEEMRRIGIKANKFTLATGLNACANLASLEEGQKLQTLVIKLGDEVDVCVHNALLDLFARCGNMDLASRVFRSMSECSEVSWTTMIMGYAQNGHPEEALKLFEEMKHRGPKPNKITFICVLYACSQGGYIDDAVEYFTSMREDYGIAPEEDHYICMVNLLGRAGHIKEAEGLISEMSFKPSILVWKTLLGACRLHGDVDTAERAAEHALALAGTENETDSSTYVLLSNIFMNIEKWGSAEILRRWIENKDIKKQPGTSWVEIAESHCILRSC